MGLLVPILSVSLLVAVGVALYAMSQKVVLSKHITQASTERDEAQQALEKSASRVLEVERKLNRAKETAAAKKGSSDVLTQKISKLTDENEQLRKTMARTAARATPAQIDQANELREKIRTLEESLVNKAKELEKATKNARYFEDQIEVVRTTVEREAAGASEAYQARVEAIVDRYQSMKKRVFEAERERRAANRQAEHNHRAYRITLRQLDLAQDQLYVARTGQEPENRKRRLQATMGLAAPETPEETSVEIDHETIETAPEHLETVENEPTVDAESTETADAESTETASA